MKNHQLTSQKSYDTFSKKISSKINEGFKIIEQNNKLPYAVLSKEKKDTNHPLHFFLSCITLGIWIIVWIYLILMDSPKKEILVAIDEDGNVFEEKCQAL